MYVCTYVYPCKNVSLKPICMLLLMCAISFSDLESKREVKYEEVSVCAIHMNVYCVSGGQLPIIQNCITLLSVTYHIVLSVYIH